MNTRASYYLSEFTGTFLMMLIGISAIVLNFGTRIMQEAISSFSVRLLLTGVFFAGGNTLVVYSPVGRISGAHLNPAVTLSFSKEKKYCGKTLVGGVIPLTTDGLANRFGGSNSGGGG